MSTRGKESLRCWVMLLHHTPLISLRPRASRSKLSSSQVVPTVKPSNTATNTPSGGRITRNRCHTIDNMSLFALRCSLLCQRGISTRKLKIYTIDGSMHSAKHECNTVITAPRRHKHPSSIANRPSDGAVTLNINAEFNLTAVNPIIECISRDLVPEYCHSLGSSAVYTGPPSFVQSLPGR